MLHSQLSVHNHPQRTGPLTGNDATLNAEAFEALYEKHWETVLNFARLRVGDADAYDVAADAFGRAWAARETFDASRGAHGTWLWSIVRNSAVDWARRSSRKTEVINRLRVSSPDSDEGRSGVFEELRTVLTAVQMQPDIDQELVALRFGAGHTNREIAEQLGMTESNVAVRLYRAIRRIRRVMEDAETEAS